MTVYVALLRAVNVGGRKLVMADLKAIAEELGFEKARTFIASGNLLLASSKSEAEVSSLLEEWLKKHMGAEVPVMVRTASEMAAIAKANPFRREPPSKVAVIFFEEPPPKDSIEQARGIADEELALGRREIYVHYPSGMGRSKLRLPARAAGTARNMNSVARLAQLAKEME
jgi:uncharacterized protein (DUF1697 family)